MRDAVTEINIDNPIARAAFICWWRTMEAQGYQYGFEALCNVWVGFDDGRADLAKKVLEVVDLPALRELFIREGAYVDPAAPGSPSPAELRVCVKCGHEERFSDNEAGYCQKLLASERNHWHAAAMECGCQCEFVDNEEINVGVYVDQD